MVTLGCAELVCYVADGWRDRTGGENGLHGVPRTFPGLSLGRSADFYYAALPLIVLGYALAYPARLTDRPFVDALEALGGNASYLSELVPNPFAGLVPGTILNNPTVRREQLLRPFPQFQGITMDRVNAGAAQYDGLEMSVNRRLSQGLIAVATYTYSRQYEEGVNSAGATTTTTEACMTRANAISPTGTITRFFSAAAVGLSLAAAALPALADLAVVTAVDDQRQCRQTELVWEGPFQGTRAHSSAGLEGLPPLLREAVARVLASGQPEAPAADEEAIGDPVRQYLREIHRVKLLTGPEERFLAARLEEQVVHRAEADGVGGELRGDQDRLVGLRAAAQPSGQCGPREPELPGLGGVGSGVTAGARRRGWRGY